MRRIIRIRCPYITFNTGRIQLMWWMNLLMAWVRPLSMLDVSIWAMAQMVASFSCKTCLCREWVCIGLRTVQSTWFNEWIKSRNFVKYLQKIYPQIIWSSNYFPLWQRIGEGYVLAWWTRKWLRLKYTYICTYTHMYLWNSLLFCSKISPVIPLGWRTSPLRTWPRAFIALRSRSLQK